MRPVSSLSRSHSHLPQLVSQSLRFISTAIRIGHYKDLFGSRETITNLVQGIVVPNVGLRGTSRPYPSPLGPLHTQHPDTAPPEHEIEQFEDDPLEYIRLDLAVPSLGGAGVSTDTLTRRQAAAEVLRALVSSGYESETTEIAGAWIGKGLQDYAANPAENWRAKDAAIYIMTAVATRGSTTQVRGFSWTGGDVMWKADDAWLA